jgi:hypothetical protein
VAARQEALYLSFLRYRHVPHETRAARRARVLLES